jgi:K+-transporting ATPase ATPase A chain
MVDDIRQFAIVLVVVTGLAAALGKWMVRIFQSPAHGVIERITYRILGVDPDERMSWMRYGMLLLLSNAAMMLLGYLFLRLQQYLPGDPLQRPSQPPDLAFNTAVAFITNTDWQSYPGETSLSNFSQMAVITFLMVVSAATGIAAGGAFIRGFCRKDASDVGNFWMDLTRAIYRLLLPLSLIVALVLVWQGVPQTLGAQAIVTTLEGARQHLVMGPVASLEAIKHIGTNGGGFFAANAAHPFENPTPLTNTLDVLCMFLIPAAFTYAFGVMVSRRRQGWAFFGAFLVVFVGFLALTYGAERAGTPMLAAAGVDQNQTAMQAGGNLEGKELRFGQAQTSLFVTATTATTTGSVDAAHDSLTPLGGLVPLAQMMLNTGFGGDGVGFINLVAYAILTVFLVGMMIGRTPEFLGRKVEAREMKLVMIAILVHPVCILGFTALACLAPATLQSLGNLGPHGLSEMLYAYASGTANNGSAFGGLNANTPFFNTTIGLAMLAGRYLTLLPMIAVAGVMGVKKSVAEGPGTLPTATPLFTTLLVCVTLVVGGLTYLPALALGPVAEHLLMLAGRTF